MAIGDVLNWFAGGRDGYMTLVHCMNHDYLWIVITVGLDLAVALGYVIIALHWRKNERRVQDTPARAALGTMKNIFVFCGICGYLFIPIKMVWPAWRLYDVFLGALAYYTWRYALRARDLGVVYNELRRTTQLEEDLEASREDGRRKSYFLNAVSHDLKTPLNALLLQSELAELSLGSNDAEGLQESLQQIRACARTTSEILNGFLDLGRLDWAQEALQLEMFRLDRTLTDLAERQRARAEQQGLTLDVRPPAGMAVRSDRVKVERILSNLVENALKFTSQGAVILEAGVGSDGVEISVSDTGLGIAPEDHSRIFDDFVQVGNRERDNRKGYGLGLGIARRLALQLDGLLTVESEPGRGSRFTLSLPRSVLVEPEHPARGGLGAGTSSQPQPASTPLGRG
jgi:signal transduction histidine kinase